MSFIINKAFRERRHPSAYRSENGQPINCPTGWTNRFPLLKYAFCQILSWKSKLKVIAQFTSWAQHPIDSHLFRSMSIDPHIPEIQLLQNLTFKIQNQGHPNILSTHIPFIPRKLTLTFVRCAFFKKLTLKNQGQGHSSRSHSEANTLSTHIPFVPCQSILTFLRYSSYKIWPWKSKVKVMGEVEIQIHNVDPTSYRLTSLKFHVNRPCHSWDTAF